MSFLKRSLLVVIAYVAACFVAAAVGAPALAAIGGAHLRGYGLFDLVTLTCFTAIFAGLGALAVILIAEWRGFRSLAYYVPAGLAVAVFTVGYFAYGAFQPAGLADYIAYALAGMAGGLAYWALAGRSKKPRGRAAAAA
ncbi:MAG: hypothetical protein QM605_13885 [Sphingobium sp.]